MAICKKCTDKLAAQLKAMGVEDGGGNTVVHSKDFPCPEEQKENAPRKI